MRARFSLLSLGVSLLALPAALAQVPPPSPKPAPAPQGLVPPSAPQPVPYPLNAKPSTPQATLTGVPVMPPAPAASQATPQPWGFNYTFPPAAPVKPKTRVFEVADLVHSPVAIPGAAALDHGKATNAHMLMKLIVAMTKPESWERGGGAGKIEYIAASESLCITNAPAVLADVQKLLDGLRRMQDQQVVLEVQIFTAPVGYGAKAGWPTEPGAKCLTPGELQKSIDAMKADKRTECISRPKMTMIDGQTGFFQVGQQVPFTQFTPAPSKGPEVVLQAHTEFLTVGTTMTCTPTISMDGKSVALKMSTSHSQMGSANAVAGSAPKAAPVDTLECQTSIVVPNGNSAITYLGAADANEVTETATPVLSKIPYMNRLFKNVRVEKKTKQEYYQIVTVRILKSGEEPAPLKAVSHSDATTVCPIPSCQPECNGVDFGSFFAPKPAQAPKHLFSFYLGWLGGM